jgi:DNA-binding transcriptional ArsR family regulator
MSRRTPKRANTHGAAETQRRRPSARAASTRGPSAAAASTFAALGDPTRLSLLAKLSQGKPHSISQLAHGSHLTRQAITKHLRVLERANVVRCVRSGRHSLYELDLQPVHELRDYLDRISAEWDEALSRLKSIVEK